MLIGLSAMIGPCLKELTRLSPLAMKKTNREEEQPMPFELLRAEQIFVKPFLVVVQNRYGLSISKPAWSGWPLESDHSGQ